MTIYAEVDPVIEKWVSSLGTALFTEWAGKPARFFHLPGNPPWECFQISIHPPENGRVSVTARAIDTNDNTEADMKDKREGPVAELDSLISAAVDVIAIWKSRAA